MNDRRTTRQRRFEKSFQRAVNNYDYRSGIHALENFLLLYPELSTSPHNLSRIGLLYDHLAMRSGAKRRMHEAIARRFYMKALSYDPAFPSAWWGLARIHWHNKDKRAIALAKKAYHLAKRRRVSVGQYAQNVGLVYEALGNFRLTKDWLSRGVSESSNEWGTHYNLLRFYINFRPKERSIPVLKNRLQRMLRGKPTNKWIRDIRKWLTHTTK